MVGGVNKNRIPQILFVDHVTGGIIALDSAHAAIHHGLHFVMSDYDSVVDIATPKYWHVKTPSGSSSSPALPCADIEYHFVFGVGASGGILIELFRNADVSADGTPIAFINSNDRSDLEIDVEGFADPTVSDDGERVLAQIVGDGVVPVVVAPGEGRCDTERILADATSYILKVTAFNDTTRVSAGVSIYQVCGDYEPTEP